MARRILQTDFTASLDAKIRGIDTRQITAADKILALDTALSRYSQDKPRIRIADITGDGGAYYVLYGQVVNVVDTSRDASIDMTSAGDDRQLAVQFTLPYVMQIHAVRALLQRVGSPAGTIGCQIRPNVSSLPGSSALQTSDSLTSASALPLGYEAGKTEFSFDLPRPLAAGTYYAAFVPSSYTYTSGTTEIDFGVDQSSVTNNLFTYNGTIWAAFGTASVGAIEIIASVPDWFYRDSDIKGAEIPAPTITSDEIPTPVEDEDFDIALVGDTEYLYLPNHRPEATDTIRLSYPGRYIFDGTPVAVDIPAAHFEAVCHLGAHFVCRWLAAKYGQNVDSGLAADLADRRNQSDVYASRAREFLADYQALLGIPVTAGEQGAAATATLPPAMKIGDMDRGTYTGRDFLFHNRRKR